MRRLTQVHNFCGLFSRKMTAELQLSLYHTITTFNTTVWEALWKHSRKRRNAGNQHFLFFPTVIFTHPKTKFNSSITFILSSANAFNLDESTNLLFGKRFRGIDSLPNPLFLRQTLVFIYNWHKKEILISNRNKGFDIQDGINHIDILHFEVTIIWDSIYKIASITLILWVFR